MRTVWKFELETEDLQGVEMPAGAKLLRVGVQRVEQYQYGPERGGYGVSEQPCLWAEVDDQAPKATRLVATHGTGHAVKPMDHGPGRQNVLPKYVGSYELLDGTLVFHVFDHGEA